MKAPSKISLTLVRFARSREKALSKVGALSLDKAEACRKILLAAGFYELRSEVVQLRIVRQLEQNLMLLLPHEQSRFKGQRETILNLIKQSHD